MMTMDQIDEMLLAYEHEKDTPVKEIGARYGVSGEAVRYPALRHGLCRYSVPVFALLPVLGEIRLVSRPRHTGEGI